MEGAPLARTGREEVSATSGPLHHAATRRGPLPVPGGTIEREAAMGHRRLPMEPCCFGGLRTQQGSPAKPKIPCRRLGRVRPVRFGGGPSPHGPPSRTSRLRASSPSAFAIMRPISADARAVRRSARAPRPRSESHSPARGPAAAGNQSSTSVSYWDAHEIGRGGARADGLCGPFQSLIPGGKRAASWAERSRN